MKDNEKLYHSALSRCAEQLDNMRDGDPITDVPDFLAAKLKQCQLAGAAKGGNTSAIDSWTGHEIMNDPSLDFVEFVKLSDAAHLAGQSQATRAADEPVDQGQVLRVIRTLLDGTQPKDIPGALIVIDHALKTGIAWSYDVAPPQGFINYVKANYTGDVHFHDPEWHAIRLWNAAMKNVGARLTPTAQEVTQQAASDNVLSSIADELEDAAIPYEGDFADTVRANVEALREVACGLPSFAGKGLCGQCAKVGRCLGCPSLAPTTQRAAKAETAEQAEGDQANVLPPTRGTESQHNADPYDVIEFALELAENEGNQRAMDFLAAWWWETNDDFLRVHWPDFAKLELASRCRAQGGNTNTENFADWLKREMPPGTVSAPEEIRNQALEEAAQMLLNGYFLHDQAPTKLFAGEAAKAIREMKRTTSGKGEAA